MFYDFYNLFCFVRLYASMLYCLYIRINVKLSRINIFLFKNQYWKINSTDFIVVVLFLF